MIGALFIINSRGDVLISRIFRDDNTSENTTSYRWVAEAFRLQVLNAKDIRSPIKCIGPTSLLHVRHGEIYVLAVANQNVDCCLIFEVLRKMVAVFKSYFGKFDEDHIRDNFVLIYELLDEILDYGYPQTSETDVLKLYITQGRARKSVSADKVKEDKIKKITVQVTGAGPCPWREPGIKYRKNELFIDVVESVNVLMSANGNVLSCNVAGQILMKSLLSGMPECKFGLNDKILMAKEARTGVARRPRGVGIELDDCTFHQCVKLGKFDSDRTISFIPPDGVFELMKYRATNNLQLPFKVLSSIKEIGRTRVEAQVTVRSTYKPKFIGTNIVVKVPVPKNTATARIRVTSGKAKYSPEDEAIVWTIKKLQGEAEASLSAEVNLLAAVSLDKKTWSRPPISLQFQVPMFTSSGLHVRFLKVFERSQYQTVKWVRYITKAGSYEFRM